MCLIFHSISFYKNSIYPEVATSALGDFALENCSRRKDAIDIFTLHSPTQPCENVLQQFNSRYHEPE